MKLSQGPVYTYILDEGNSLNDIRECLTFVDEERFFKKAYRNKHWDGKYRYLKSSPSIGLHYFKSGFLSWVIEHLSESYVVRRKKIPHPTEVDPEILPHFSMTGRYSFQHEVVETALREEYGVLDLATNAGKTICAAAIIKATQFPTLFVVPSKALLFQSSKTLREETDLDVGLLGAGNKDLDSHVVVGIANSVTKQDSDWLARFRMVIVDECHLSSADTYINILDRCRNAFFRFGMSGTPFDRKQLNNIKLMSVLGGRIYEVSNADLIEAGVSARPTVRLIPIEESSEVPKNEDSWKSCYKANITDNDYRNKKIVKVVDRHVNKGDKVLVLVRMIKHGKTLETMLQDEGFDIPFYYGDTKADVLEEGLDDLRSGDRNALILSSIGEIGIDIPNLDVMVRATGYKSTVSVLQGLGRLLRAEEEGEEVFLYDFNDKLDTFNEEHSESRHADYLTEGFTIVKYEV